ncbi:anti-ECFsigma factor, ChrR [Nostoc carneum NIES-2107]|nr:anti-ECFsigma factor, ChrR [Nostoc carneum NIES-2107]
MKQEEFDELAASYALNILAQADFPILEEAIANSPELESELAALTEVAAALAYSAPSVPMAANLKARLFERINNETSMTALQEKAADVEWQAYTIPGVMVGTLYQDNEKREIACFVRSVANIRFPKHQHAENEEIVVLEGDLIVDGEIYQAGDRIYSLPNTVHQPETQQGCLLFLKTSLDDQIIT